MWYLFEFVSSIWVLVWVEPDWSEISVLHFAMFLLIIVHLFLFVLSSSLHRKLPVGFLQLGLAGFRLHLWIRLSNVCFNRYLGCNVDNCGEFSSIFGNILHFSINSLPCINVHKGKSKHCWIYFKINAHLKNIIILGLLHHSVSEKELRWYSNQTIKLLPIKVSIDKNFLWQKTTQSKIFPEKKLNTASLDWLHPWFDI